MIKLSELHGQPIDVEVLIVGKKSTLSGVGHYEKDPALGSVLRIRFGAEAGGMEILLEEKLWRGFVGRPTADSPYIIRLDSLAPAAHAEDVQSQR